jgi:hypothetical protein
MKSHVVGHHGHVGPLPFHGLAVPGQEDPVVRPEHQHRGPGHHGREQRVRPVRRGVVVAERVGRIGRRAVAAEEHQGRGQAAGQGAAGRPAGPGEDRQGRGQGRGPGEGNQGERHEQVAEEVRVLREELRLQHRGQEREPDEQGHDQRGASGPEQDHPERGHEQARDRHQVRQQPEVAQDVPDHGREVEGEVLRVGRGREHLPELHRRVGCAEPDGRVRGRAEGQVERGEQRQAEGGQGPGQEAQGVAGPEPDRDQRREGRRGEGREQRVHARGEAEGQGRRQGASPAARAAPVAERQRHEDRQEHQR